MTNLRPVGVLDVAPQVMKLLGVEIAGVVSFSLHFDAGDVVRLRVEHLVDKDRLQQVLDEFVIDWRQGEQMPRAPEQPGDDAIVTAATVSSGSPQRGWLQRLRAAFASARARLWPPKPPLTLEEQQLRQAILDGFAGTRSTRRPARSAAPTPASAAQSTAPGES